MGQVDPNNPNGFNGEPYFAGEHAMPSAYAGSASNSYDSGASAYPGYGLLDANGVPSMGEDPNSTSNPMGSPYYEPKMSSPFGVAMGTSMNGASPVFDPTSTGAIVSDGAMMNFSPEQQQQAYNVIDMMSAQMTQNENGFLNGDANNNMQQLFPQPNFNVGQEVAVSPTGGPAVGFNANIPPVPDATAGGTNSSDQGGSNQQFPVPPPPVSTQQPATSPVDVTGPGSTKSSPTDPPTKAVRAMSYEKFNSKPSPTETSSRNIPNDTRKSSNSNYSTSKPTSSPTETTITTIQISGNISPSPGVDDTSNVDKKNSGSSSSSGFF